MTPKLAEGEQLSIAQASCSSIMLKQCLARATNVRTHLRKNYSPCLVKDQLVSARRGAARFTQLGDENSRPQRASRGLTAVIA